jgi:hypothetical protein
MIPLFERTKTVHALDCTATLVELVNIYSFLKSVLLNALFSEDGVSTKIRDVGKHPCYCSLFSKRVIEIDLEWSTSSKTWMNSNKPTTGLRGWRRRMLQEPSGLHLTEGATRMLQEEGGLHLTGGATRMLQEPGGLHLTGTATRTPQLTHTNISPHNVLA